ncbi:matrixin family metalloprotease [Dehalobacter sp. DCM]|uniref:matrixin family metalloprotease n=1 Tax=Dehalobacter sp. DCM TaxID=2907827 RepID=UPI003081ECE4|nr:matrixin family metalloprotease [Dehalobacter sp. DCM]
MKIKQNKYLRSIILSISFIILFVTPVYAITPTFTYSCSRGVNVYYYIENGSSNPLYTPIRDAAYNWEHTGFGYNPIYLYIKSTNSGTAIDFYAKTSAYWGEDGDNIGGQTRPMNASGYEIDPNLSNWLYSEIYLNNTALSTLSSSLRQGISAHEMGHAFGLKHYNTNPTGSIMCQTSYGRTVQTVQQEDNDAINAKY